MNAWDLLARGNYIMFNKELAHTVGVDEAIMIGELASGHKQHKDQLKDGYFYLTIDTVEMDTALSEKRQRTAIKHLEEMGILETKLMGLPAKRYFKLNPDVLFEDMNNFCQNGVQSSCCSASTSSADSSELDTALGQTNKIINNKNTNTKTKDKTKDNINPILYSSPCESEKKTKEVKRTYGEYENVRFTDTELAKLQTEFPNDWQDRINKLSGYMASTGKTYKNHLATIRNWARMEQDRQKTAKQPDPNDGWAYLEEQYQKGEL